MCHRIRPPNADCSHTTRALNLAHYWVLRAAAALKVVRTVAAACILDAHSVHCSMHMLDCANTQRRYTGQLAPVLRPSGMCTGACSSSRMMAVHMLTSAPSFTATPAQQQQPQDTRTPSLIGHTETNDYCHSSAGCGYICDGCSSVL